MGFTIISFVAVYVFDLQNNTLLSTYITFKEKLHWKQTAVISLTMLTAHLSDLDGLWE